LIADLLKENTKYSISRAGKEIQGVLKESKNRYRTNINLSRVKTNLIENQGIIDIYGEVTVDELDKTTSTESFCGWRRWRRCNSCGYGNTSYSYNYNSYNNYSNHNNYNWSFYSPAYYNYGYYYGYNYANTYNYAGYNYYQYNSSFGSSYSGQGYAPGYGAAY
jgi:hypothetical protein